MRCMKSCYTAFMGVGATMSLSQSTNFTVINVKPMRQTDCVVCTYYVYAIQGQKARFGGYAGAVPLFGVVLL